MNTAVEFELWYDVWEVEHYARDWSLSPFIVYVVLILRFEFSAASMDVPTSCPSTPKWNLDRPFLTGCFHQVSHLSLSVCLYCNEHESVSIYYIFFCLTEERLKKIRVRIWQITRQVLMLYHMIYQSWNVLFI